MSEPARSRAMRAVAAAALVLAVTSRGELGVLALLLVALDVTLPATVALTGVVVAASWRWGTTSLEALAGAQAVLGPAGGVGPAAAAAGSWLAGLALLLVLGRGGDVVRHAAVGAAVAAVLAGPAPGGDLPVRGAVAVGVAAAAFGLAGWRRDHPRADRRLSWLGAASGAGAVVAVAVADVARPSTVELALVAEGLAIAAAVAVPVLALGWSVPRPRWRQVEASPTVSRLHAAPAPLPSSRPR